MNIEFIGRFKKGTKDERLAFRVKGNCNVHQYLIYDTTFDIDGDMSNLCPHMYRFPSQAVLKGGYVYLYIHDKGNRKSIDCNDEDNMVYRFSWGLDVKKSVFNSGGDYLHIAEINETRIAVIDK